MKTKKFIILFSALALIFIWGCEKDVLTSTDNDQQISIRNPGNGNGNSSDSNNLSPCKGKSLGPWGIPDGLLHVYETAAQDFPCDFNKARKVTSVWARLARTGNPTDNYFVTIRNELDGPILAQSIAVPVADVIDEFVNYGEGEWVEFPFDPPYLMGAGDYFVQMERTGPWNNQDYMNWTYDGSNPLPDHAGWVYTELYGWTIFGPYLSDEFLIALCYK
jgi:hypothetical protein